MDVSGIVLLEDGFAAELRRSLAGLKLLDLVSLLILVEFCSFS
jgi:hypothetical protein